jgi:hypothetical protein
MCITDAECIFVSSCINLRVCQLTKVHGVIVLRRCQMTTPGNVTDAWKWFLVGELAHYISLKRGIILTRHIDKQALHAHKR